MNTRDSFVLDTLWIIFASCLMNMAAAADGKDDGKGIQSDSEHEEYSEPSFIKWCLTDCKNESEEGMIACDGGCKNWFHFVCVGLKEDSVPSDKDWFCEQCVSRLGVKPRGTSDKPQKLLQKQEKKQPTARLSKDLGLPKKKAESNMDEMIEETNRRAKLLELEVAKKRLKQAEQALAGFDLKEPDDKNKQRESSANQPKLEADHVSAASASTVPSQSSNGSDAMLKLLLEAITGRTPPEKLGKKDNTKSGLFKKSEDDVVAPQFWPHMKLGMEFALKKYAVSELTLPLLVAGELECIDLMTDQQDKGHRLSFLKNMMYQAEVYETSKVVEAYVAWLRACEGGAPWSQMGVGVVDVIFRRATPRKEDKKMKWSSSEKKGKGVWFCKPYQFGKCERSSPHKADILGVTREVKHVCAPCLIKGKEEKEHPESSSECPFKKSE